MPFLGMTSNTPKFYFLGIFYVSLHLYSTPLSPPGRDDKGILAAKLKHLSYLTQILTNNAHSGADNGKNAWDR